MAQNIARVGDFEVNQQTGVISFSDAAQNILGLNVGQNQGGLASLTKLLHPEDRPNFEKVTSGSHSNEAVDLDVRITDPTGGWRHVALRALPSGGRWALGTVQDITQRRDAEKNLRLADKIFQATSQAIVITDSNSRIQRVNPAFTQITGYSRDAVVGKNPAFLKSGRHDQEFFRALWQQLLDDGQWSGEIWNKRQNGEVYPQWLSINALRDESGHVANYVGLFTDISGMKDTELRLQQMAYHDSLTRLPNRALFWDRLKIMQHRIARHGGLFALLYLDLDGFKPVNDRLGHDAGDDLLCQVAERLTQTVRKNDTVARLGGDATSLKPMSSTRASS